MCLVCVKADSQGLSVSWPGAESITVLSHRVATSYTWPLNQKKVPPFVAQLVGCHSTQPKVAGLTPSQGTILAVGLVPGGTCQRQSVDISL